MSKARNTSIPTDEARMYHARTRRVEVLGQIAARFAPAIGERAGDYGAEVECSPAMAESRDRMLIRIFDAIDLIAAGDD